MRKTTKHFNQYNSCPESLSYTNLILCERVLGVGFFKQAFGIFGD